jgi:hypothetical protein
MGSYCSKSDVPFIITQTYDVKVMSGGRFQLVGKCESLKECQILVAKYMKDPGAFNLR